MSPTYRYPRPAVTLDVTFFAVRDGRLQILLIRRGHDPFAGRWALPGGFLDEDEELANQGKPRGHGYSEP